MLDKTENIVESIKHNTHSPNPTTVSTMALDFVYKYKMYFEYALIFKLNLYIIEIWVVVISMFFVFFYIF